MTGKALGPLPRLLTDWARPVVTVKNKVIVDDSLYLDSDQIYIKHFFECKLKLTRLQTYRPLSNQLDLQKLLINSFNIVMLYLRQNKLTLAFATLLQTREVLKVQPKFASDHHFAEALVTTSAHEMKDG